MARYECQQFGRFHSHAAGRHKDRDRARIRRPSEASNPRMRVPSHDCFLGFGIDNIEVVVLVASTISEVVSVWRQRLGALAAGLNRPCRLSKVRRNLPVSVVWEGLLCSQADLSSCRLHLVGPVSLPFLPFQHVHRYSPRRDVCGREILLLLASSCAYRASKEAQGKRQRQEVKKFFDGSASGSHARSLQSRLANSV